MWPKPCRSIRRCLRGLTSTVCSPALTFRNPTRLTDSCAAFPNGTSALLLHLSGTIPVLFRGATYRFPISLWVPHAYPREPPLVYVTPTQTMMVRPGQHVDPQGQVYHPYLVGWSTFWDVRCEGTVDSNPQRTNSSC
jgi:hypothetical protein